MSIFRRNRPEQKVVDPLNTFVQRPMSGTRSPSLLLVAFPVVSVAIAAMAWSDRAARQKLQESPAVNTLSQPPFYNSRNFEQFVFDFENETDGVKFYANMKAEDGKFVKDANGKVQWFECKATVSVPEGRPHYPDGVIPAPEKMFDPTSPMELANCIKRDVEYLPWN